MSVPTAAGIVSAEKGLRPGRFEAVGPQEMSVLFGVTMHAIYQWKLRDLLPPSDDTVSGKEIWHIRTLLQWGLQTGRTTYLHPDVYTRYQPLAA